MSMFSKSSGGSGLTPEQYAGLVQDAELSAVRAGIVADLQPALAGAGLPVGTVMEFPASQIPSGWQAIQGSPVELPTGSAYLSPTRTTNGSSQGWAITPQANKLWHLSGSRLAYLDLITNVWDSFTYTVPSAPGSQNGMVLHDYHDSKVLITRGTNANNWGSGESYVFDAVSKLYTRITDFLITGADAVVRAGLGGTSLRLADGRLFWLPKELRSLTSTTAVDNYASADTAGCYFIYDPATESVTTGRIGNWSTALAGTALSTTTNASAVSGSNSNLPIGQLPDGRLFMQELSSTVSSSRYFFIDIVAGTITKGNGSYGSEVYALAPSPQGLHVFDVATTTRRTYDAAGDVLSLTTTTAYNTVTARSISAAGNYFFKALRFGNGNYALPSSSGSSAAAALHFDTFERLGTVKAVKLA